MSAIITAIAAFGIAYVMHRVMTNSTKSKITKQINKSNKTWGRDVYL